MAKGLFLPLLLLMLSLVAVAPVRAEECAGSGCDNLLLAGEPFNVTAEQASQLKGIHARYSDQKKQLQDDINDRRAAVISLLASDNATAEAVKARLRQIVELEGRRQQLLVEEYFEVLTVLRPDQKRIYRERLVQRLLDR